MAEAAPFDVAGTLAALAQGLFDELMPVVEKGAGDLKVVVDKIAPKLLAASLAGDKAEKDELLAQLKGIAEINGIRASAAGWRTFGTVTSIALKSLSIGLSVVTGNGIAALTQALGIVKAGVAK